MIANFAEYESLTLDESVEVMNKLGDELERCREVATGLQKSYDFLRRVIVPRRFEELNLTSSKFTNINRGVRIQDELFVSVAEGQQSSVQEWFVDHGEADMIKQTINPSTLKAYVSRVLKEGGEYPSDFLKITIIPTARFY